jgi:hypothetical protein
MAGAPASSVSPAITLSMNTANDGIGQGDEAQENYCCWPSSRISAPDKDKVDGVLELYLEGYMGFLFSFATGKNGMWSVGNTVDLNGMNRTIF